MVAGDKTFIWIRIVPPAVLDSWELDRRGLTVLRPILVQITIINGEVKGRESDMRFSEENRGVGERKMNVLYPSKVNK